MPAIVFGTRYDYPMFRKAAGDAFNPYPPEDFEGKEGFGNEIPAGMKTGAQNTGAAAEQSAAKKTNYTKIALIGIAILAVVFIAKKLVKK